MADEEVLPDATVRATAGLEFTAKTQLAVIGDSMYQKDRDGNWYRLSNERDIDTTH